MCANSKARGILSVAVKPIEAQGGDNFAMKLIDDEQSSHDASTETKSKKRTKREEYPSVVLIDACSDDDKSAVNVNGNSNRIGSLNCDDDIAKSSWTGSKRLREDVSEEGPISSNPFAAFSSGSVPIAPSLPPSQSTEPKPKPKPKPKSKTKAKKCVFSPLATSPLSVQMSELKKWRSFVPQKMPINECRFQTLVAARLHAQAKEKQVGIALATIRSHFEGRSGSSSEQEGFNVQTFATSVSEEELTSLVKNINFWRSKCQQIIKGE